MTPFAIEVRGVSKAYRKRGRPPVHAVRPLDLAVPAGQLFGFLGPNGAGKTTTIKMLCGLITPDGGQVRLNGYDVQRQRGAAMRQIGAVLEGTRNVHWRLSAWQNLQYFGGIKGSPPSRCGSAPRRCCATSTCGTAATICCTPSRAACSRR